MHASVWGDLAATRFDKTWINKMIIESIYKNLFQLFKLSLRVKIA